MQYILDVNGDLIARCESGQLPPLPGGQHAAAATPELDAAWAALAETPPPVPPSIAYELSKYVILERLIARGLGVAFLQVLASDPLTQARWDAATGLDSDNPLFLAAQHQLIPALGATPAEAAQILRPGRDIP